VTRLSAFTTASSISAVPPEFSAMTSTAISSFAFP